MPVFLRSRRRGIVKTVAVIALVGLTDGARGRPAGAQESRKSSRTNAAMKHSLFYVEQKAIAARSNEPSAVRSFTDEIFARSLFANVAPSIKNRVFGNELAFRADQRSGISEQDIVETLNRQMSLYQLPSAMRVSLGQLRAVRRHARTYIRHYAKSDPARGEPPTALSPAEAAVVTAHLILQKLHNPQFQVDPEQWERDETKRQSDAKTVKKTDVAVPSPGARFEVRAQPNGRAYSAIMRALSDESSDVVAEFHNVLDGSGFQR